MYQFDHEALKAEIDSFGMKQKAVAMKAGIKENHFCLILSGKRKCEAGEYISLCKVLEVNPWAYMKEERENE